jgi:DNA-binding FadR family transcriptional regulator
MNGVPARRRVQPRRTAEVLAGELRDQILRRELTALPRIEDLTAQYQVGAPALREAMRILETEGLITVRRGSIGGAEVHLPTPDGVAYMMSLVLQSNATNVRDVGLALRHLEPVCAALCASRPDRASAVVPSLQQLVDEQADAIGDAPRFGEIVDRFHRTIVTACGNESLIVVVGALEAIWAGHTHEVYARDSTDHIDTSRWKASVRDHQRIVDAIADGDQRVGALAARHLEAVQAYIREADGGIVSAAATASAIR